LKPVQPPSASWAGNQNRTSRGSHLYGLVGTARR